ncbi:MAG TPA: ABC transporter permease, partial [Candidatus Dormibacteraeota bacterium]|nr:ABC transporter permease [Candidatus Dormibacteraeota bacterium]
MLLRDLSVLRREFIAFLIRTVMNPLMFVFVFTYLFPKMGQGFQSARGIGFGTLILPGLIAVGIFFQGIMATALPLSVEIGATREIHDRVMSPLPVEMVAVEKIVFSAIQSVLAAVVIFPLVYFIPATPVQVHVANWITLIAVVLLASLVSGAVGLTIGVSVKPQQIGLIFGIIVVPVTFLGCVYYPWALLEKVRWLQILVLLN